MTKTVKTFKVHLNKDLVNIFTDRFAQLETFLKEVVELKLIGFIMSTELAAVVSGLTKFNDAIIASMNLSDENHGSNSERIQYAVRMLSKANYDISEEIVQFARNAVDSFIARFDAVEDTSVFMERKLRFATELKLYCGNVTRSNVSADQAIKAYSAMHDFVSWIEESAQKERDALEEEKNPQNIAARVHEVLAPAPSKRKSTRRYVMPGDKRAEEKNRGKNQKSGKSRHQKAATA